MTLSEKESRVRAYNFQTSPDLKETIAKLEKKIHDKKYSILVAHVGKPMVLFLEIDDDDCKASKGAKSEDGTNQDSSGDPRCGNGDMHELLLGMSCIGIYNKSGEYYVTANLAKHNTELEERNNELMKELEEANNLLEIERSNREEDDVDNLKLELEEERNVRRRKEASLRTMNIHLQRELLEVVRLSNENKKLKEQACQISLLQRELRANRRVLNAYEDKFGPYQPADFSRFSHNGPFVSSEAQLCPQCKVVHIGSATVLFIDLDEEDFEASKGAKNKAKSKSTARTSDNCTCGNAEMRQLAWGMVSMNIDNKDSDFYIVCELASRNEGLEDINSTLREELEDAYHALNGGKSDDEELDELAIQLADQSRRAEA
ncbi:hypothetical protein GGH94_004304 [Coemansia aciculifera]|uniref:Uncharacterized protein n=1 Tax=Coemansia aciculifera TaxID=417176 RepID=A0A9W8INQ5_9FUNG|nr:hypothetical protein GGH94_004304 [Coemansia aciculifera]